jgi:hypothetical protein
MHHELDPQFVAISERGFKTPVANIARVTAIPSAVMIRLCIKHSFTRRGLGSSWISTTQRPPSGRSAWVRVGASLTADRLATVLDISSAMTMLAEARPLAGGSSHRKGVIRDKSIIDFLQRTCASTSMKVATRGL